MRKQASALLVLAVTACSSGSKKEDTKPTQADAKQKPAAVEPQSLAPPPGLDLDILDAKADPCTDFYRFACGGWLDKTEIPADRSTYGRGFSTIQDKNQDILKALLEEIAAGKAPEGTPHAAALGDFFGTCMDDAQTEAGKATLDAELKALDKVKDAKTAQAALVALHQKGISPFFGVGSLQSFKDASKVVAGLDQGGLGMPDRDYYLEDNEKMRTTRNAYLAHVEKMLTLAGTKPDVAKKDAAAVLALETALAKASLSKVERRDPDKLDHPMDAKGLKALAANVDWAGYLKGLGLSDATPLNVSHPPFFTAVSDALKQEKPAVVAAYLRWHTVRALAPFLGKAFHDESFQFRATNFTGEKADLPRWKQCVQWTDGALGEALAVPFVQKTFGADGKATTLEMVVQLEAAFERNLATLSWMDQPTKDKALGKLKTILNKIGYPDAWRKYDDLKTSRGAFAGNVVASNTFEFRRDLNKIGKPVDKNEWYMSPPTVNAYYNPQVNEIVFPAGILQPPFFNKEATAAVNYGAMGMVVGHEITHGFDDEGSKFDELGNKADWWTAESKKNFEERTACVKTQFDGYTAVDDQKINGALTLGENVADLGGLKLSMLAMQEATKDKAAELDGYRFNRNQQFFLGYAQSWCSKWRDEARRMRNKTDPHSPPEWRVNGPLGNLAAFQDAFKCAPGSKMVRPAAERCEVW